MSSLREYFALLLPVAAVIAMWGYILTRRNFRQAYEEIEEWRGTVDIVLSGRGADADRMIVRARDLYVRDMIDLEQFEDAVEDILWGDSWELLSLPHMYPDSGLRSAWDGP